MPKSRVAFSVAALAFLTTVVFVFLSISSRQSEERAFDEAIQAISKGLKAESRAMMSVAEAKRQTRVFQEWVVLGAGIFTIGAGVAGVVLRRKERQTGA